MYQLCYTKKQKGGKSFMSQIDIHVGSRIRFFRKQNGMSVQDLAERMNKKASTIYKYEQGIISVDVNTLVLLSDILGIRYYQLLDYSDEQSSMENNKAGNFFKSHLYCYHYDGRQKRIIHSRIDCLEDVKSARQDAIFYYDLQSECQSNITTSRYLYYGSAVRYDYINYFTFQNRTNEAEHMQIIMYHPWNYNGFTWGMLCGILDHPITPASCKILISKNQLSSDELTISKLSFRPDELNRIKNTNFFALFFQ